MDNHGGIGPGEHLDATGERKVVYCHQCENEWWQDEHGLVCPRCEGEATEIVEPNLDPRDLRSPATNLPSLRDFYDHNPWESTSADSDPEEADIEEHVTRGPGGSIMISQTIRSTPVRHRSRPEPVRRRSMNPYTRDRASEDPNRYMVRQFQGMLENLMNPGPEDGPPRGNGPDYEDRFPRLGEVPGRRPMPYHPLFDSIEEPPEAPWNRNGQGRGFSYQTRGEPFLGSRFTFTTGRLGGPSRAVPDRADGAPVDQLATLLSSLFGPPAGDHPARDGPAARPLGNQLPALLAALMNPANAAHGDAVYSQEALDRVISQLMEAHPTSSSAPGPASPSTISSLPKRALTDKDLEGNKKVIGKNGEEEMKGECSVCMDDVGVGDEMVFLPCKHWFHETCASAWLSEHDSCPICRKSISPERSSNSNNNGGNGSGNANGNGRNPFVRRESGSMGAGFSNNWGSNRGNPSNSSASSNADTTWASAPRRSIFTTAGRRERAREREEREAEREAERVAEEMVRSHTAERAALNARVIERERRRAPGRSGSGSDGHSRWTSSSNAYDDDEFNWASDGATRGSSNGSVSTISRRFSNYGRPSLLQRGSNGSGHRARSTSPPDRPMPGSFAPTPPRRDSARSSRSGSVSGSGGSSGGDGGILSWVRDRFPGARRGDSNSNSS